MPEAGELCGRRAGVRLCADHSPLRERLYERLARLVLCGVRGKGPAPDAALGARGGPARGLCAGELLLPLGRGADRGHCRIRHRLTPALAEGAGHFGYFIGRAFRGRGYATEALRLLLDIARDLVPEEEFFLRVNKDNPASLRVMLRNGAYIHHEDDVRFYVRIPKNK